jgi:hypothetical protein
MGYSAGDLSVELFGIDTNAVASIDNTAKALKRLSSALRSIEKLQSLWTSEKLQYIFEGIANATNSINATNIERLASATKSLTSLTKIGKLQDIDYGKIGQGFASLTTAITPFIDKVITAETALQSLNETMRLVNGRKLKGLSSWSGDVGGKKSGGKSGGGLFGLAKITTLLYSARRLGGILAKIAQSGADYTETLNLWETAMTRNLAQATAFVKKMNEAYGISEKTLMNAQATFKNMLGSLGQISESTAYALSEGITQMAIDYASLYNVNFEKAFEKFQSALAGQVRPIRSVSGYDITENTIFELYKQLGGEKSVRNLSRTEKQLLAILAVFNQMQASGAVGDLNKTMESYANQSRVLSEAWKELTSYIGITVTYLIQESGILRGITAQVIALGQIFKAFAEQSGAIQSFGGDIFGGTEQSAESASNAIDELNGKLADFDKFRALNESGDSQVAIDEKLLSGLERYKSILEGATNSARELAEVWLKNSGFMNGEGVFDVQKVEGFINEIDGFFQSVIAFIATGAIKKLIALITDLIASVGTLGTVLNILSNVALFIAIRFIIEAIEKFQEGDHWGGILAVTIGVSLVAAIVALRLKMLDLSKDTFGFNTLMRNLGVSVLGTVAAIGLLVGGIIAISTADMGGWQKAITIFVSLAAAIGAAAIALHAFKGNWGKALTVAGIVAGGVLLIGSALGNASVNKFAEGGLPDKGTMFVAGEAGAEMVYNMPSGQSGVANIQQIAQANYNGTIKALNDWWGGMGAKGDIPKLQSASATGIYQAVSGVAKSRGEHWSKY